MNAVKSSAPGIEYDFTGLHNFIRFMDSTGKFVVKVGIFGNKNARGITSTQKPGKSGLRKAIKSSPSTMTNAEIGLVHELGSVARHIPPRSFLRMPISVKSKQILADSMTGAVELIAKGNMKGVLARLGIACEKWIQIAFGTRGFGTWLTDHLSTIQRKGSNAPLIDTAQLRRSIASKVDAK